MRMLQEKHDEMQAWPSPSNAPSTPLNRAGFPPVVTEHGAPVTSGLHFSFATQLHLKCGSAAMRPMKTKPDYQQRASESLAKFGARVTRPRIAVLAALFASARPLSHHELEQQLADACDRVTLYRVLAWLVESNFAHRVSGEDRVWRFSAARHSDHKHAHFHCHSCGVVLCMDTVTPSAGVPKGFRLDEVELNLRGLCPECIE